MILKTQMQSKELRDDCFGNFDSMRNEYNDKDRTILHISANGMKMDNSDFLESAWELGKLVFNE